MSNDFQSSYVTYHYLRWRLPRGPPSAGVSFFLREAPRAEAAVSFETRRCAISIERGESFRTGVTSSGEEKGGRRDGSRGAPFGE